MTDLFESFNFGAIYRDAHLSKIELPEGKSEVLQNWYKNPKFILYFAGNPGLGKTYFCACVVKDLCDKKKHVYYTTEQKFLNRLRGTIQKDWDYNQEVEKMAEYNFFILDDLGSSQMTDWQKEVLFTFVDYRLKSGLPTIITSNHFTRDLTNTLSERFSSRIKDKRNTILEFKGSDKRQE